jgi:hypothetical protein
MRMSLPPRARPGRYHVVISLTDAYKRIKVLRLVVTAKR